MSEKFKNRVKMAKEKIKEYNLDGLLLYKPNNIMYYSGVGQEDVACACVVIPKDGDPELVTLWTDVKYAKKKTWMKVSGYTLAKGILHGGVAEVVKKLGIEDGKFGLDKDWLQVGQFEMLQQTLPNATFPEAPEIFLYTWIDELRMYKTPDEVEIMRRAAEIADLAMEAAVKAVKPGVTGYDIAAEAEYVMRKNGSGSWFGAHPTLVAYGELLHHAHPFACGEKIPNNGLVTIDLGAVIEGYHSDLCRTIALGKITDEEEKAAQANLNGQSAAIEKMRPGVSINDIDAATREGLGEYAKYHYGPGLVGHGVGLGNGIQAFDCPFIATGDERKVQKDMVLALFEIPPFIPGIGAPRFEDMILVTDDEPEILTKYPRELIRI
jgi:Xaa-Pro aminopeptidase